MESLLKKLRCLTLKSVRKKEGRLQSMEYKVELKDWPYQVKAAVMRGNRPFMNHCHHSSKKGKSGSYGCWRICGAGAG